eukprot:tig00000581_g2239.t1
MSDAEELERASSVRSGRARSSSPHERDERDSSPPRGCHVHVAVRVKPVNEGERQAFSVAGDTISLDDAEIGDHRTFTFDQVYDARTSQSLVYENSVRKAVRTVLKGRSAAVFLYGQTSTGKSYSLEGPAHGPVSERGIIQRAIEHILDYSKSRSAAKRGGVNIFVSFLQVQNENLYDLLKPRNKNLKIMEGLREPGEPGSTPTAGLRQRPATPGSAPLTPQKDIAAYNAGEVKEAVAKIGKMGQRVPEVPKLKIGQLPPRVPFDPFEADREERRRGTHVKGLTERRLDSFNAADKIFKRSALVRAAATEEAEDLEARSHTVFTVGLYSDAEIGPDGQPIGKGTKLHFVEYAGSEKPHEKDGYGRGAPAVERRRIALAFDAFTNMIQFLHGACPHKPFRDCKVNHVLRDTFVPGCELVLLATISPSPQYTSYKETLATLKFAQRIHTIGMPTVPKSFGGYKEDVSRVAEAVMSLASRGGSGVDVSRSTERAASAPPSRPTPRATPARGGSPPAHVGLRESVQSGGALSASSEQRAIAGLEAELSALLSGTQTGAAPGDVPSSYLRLSETLRELRGGAAPLDDDGSDLLAEGSGGPLPANLTESEKVDALERQVLAYKIALRRAKHQREVVRKELMSRVVAALKVTEELRAEAGKAGEGKERVRRDLAESRARVMREIEARELAEAEVERWKSAHAKQAEAARRAEEEARAAAAELRREVKQRRVLQRAEADASQAEVEERMREAGDLRADLREAVQAAQKLAEQLQESEAAREALEEELDRRDQALALREREKEGLASQLAMARQEAQSIAGEKEGVLARLVPELKARPSYSKPGSIYLSKPVLQASWSYLSVEAERAGVERDLLQQEVQKLRAYQRRDAERIEQLQRANAEEAQRLGEVQAQLAATQAQLRDALGRATEAAKERERDAARCMEEISEARREAAAAKVQAEGLQSQLRAALADGKEGDRVRRVSEMEKEEYARRLDSAKRDALDARVAAEKAALELVQLKGTVASLERELQAARRKAEKYEQLETGGMRRAAAARSLADRHAAACAALDTTRAFTAWRRWAAARHARTVAGDRIARRWEAGRCRDAWAAWRAYVAHRRRKAVRGAARRGALRERASERAGRRAGQAMGERAERRAERTGRRAVLQAAFADWRTEALAQRSRRWESCRALLVWKTVLDRERRLKHEAALMESEAGRMAERDELSRRLAALDAEARALHDGRAEAERLRAERREADGALEEARRELAVQSTLAEQQFEALEEAQERLRLLKTLFVWKVRADARSRVRMETRTEDAERAMVEAERRAEAAAALRDSEVREREVAGEAERGALMERMALCLHFKFHDRQARPRPAPPRPVPPRPVPPAPRPPALL